MSTCLFDAISLQESQILMVKVSWQYIRGMQGGLDLPQMSRDVKGLQNDVALDPSLRFSLVISYMN